MCQHRLRPGDGAVIRQARARVLACLENRCGRGHSDGGKRAGGLGGRGQDHRRLLQARGEKSVGLIIAARVPVGFGKEKIDADDPRRCCCFHQPGELVARPGPLSDMADRILVDVDDKGPVFRPRPQPVPLICVEHPVAQIGERSVG